MSNWLARCQKLITFAAMLTALLVLLLSASLLVLKDNIFKIDTDLRSISPQFIADEGVEAAINNLSVAVEQQLYLVLKSTSPEELEEAAEVVVDWVDSKGPSNLSLIGDIKEFEPILTLLKQYRYQLLTSDQALKVQQSNDEQLLAAANRRLYSLSGGSRLFNLVDDPMGFVTDFGLSIGDNIAGSGSEEMLVVTGEGGTFYYMPFLFSIEFGAGGFNDQQKLLNKLRSLESLVDTQYPEIDFLHSGIFFFAAEAAKSAKADITIISTGSTIGILLLIIIVFRSAGPIVLPLISILTGVAIAFLFCQFLYGSIHIFTIVFGASLIGVVIDYALHYAYHYGKNRTPQSLEKLYKALLLSLLTSMIGYGALMFSGLDVLKQVTVFSVIGLVGAWLVVLILGRFLLQRQRRIHDVYLRYVIARLLKLVSGVNPKAFILCCGLLMIGGLSLIVWRLDFFDSPRSFINPNPNLLQQQVELGGILSHYEPATFMIMRARNSQSLFDLSSKLRQFIGDDSSNISLLGADSLLPSPQEQNRNYSINGKLYGENGVALRFLGERGMEKERLQKVSAGYHESESLVLVPGELFTELQSILPPLWQENLGWHYNLMLIPQGADTSLLMGFANENDNAFFIDSVGMSTDAIRQLRVSAVQLLVFALLLVVVLLVVRYRKLKSATLIFVPAISIVLTLAYFAVVGSPVSLFHVMALFLVLGLGMDYVIFSYDMADYPEQTLSAVFLSSITSLLAFGLLGLSDLPVVAAFGSTVLVGNSLNTLGSVFVVHFCGGSKALTNFKESGYG